MNGITQRLSVAELTHRILEMAKTGVYRTSIFEAFHSLATKKQISQAIRQAKQFGLHSVANLRDSQLGTYYQLDEAKYRSLQKAIQSAVPLGIEDDPVKRATEAMLTIQFMLRIAGGLAIVLIALDAFCFWTGRWGMGWEVLAGVLSAIGIWSMQRSIAKKLM